MKSNRWSRILCLTAALAVLAGSALADGPVSFSAEGYTWEVSFPAQYIVYTKEMGEDSLLLKLTGASTDDMDWYMTGLGCSVVGVHLLNSHELWLSVSDRSPGVGRVGLDGEVPKDIQEAFFDGASFGRGPYTVETFEGRDYYVFADGKSIYEGGINYRICTFIGQYEIMLRWESGTGERTAEDISELKGIIRSVKPVN